MPNLNNIFNNFFPQSQTGKKGLFLLRMAWTIEIFVAIIGFIIGLIIMKGSQTEEGTSQAISGFSFLGNMTLNDFSIGLIFMIVAIVELTKIPLATAVYYSVRLSWRLVFILGLLLVNVSTFETIVTGFERINRERTKLVGDYITKYHSILTQIEHLSIDERADDIDEDIEKLIEQRSKIQSQIDANNLSAEKQIKELQETSGNKEAIVNLQNKIDTLSQEISDLRKDNSKLALDAKGAWNKKLFKDQINANNITIEEKIHYYNSLNKRETTENKPETILDKFHKEDFLNCSEEEKKLIIEAVLDQAIRPALANDGGGIDVLGIEGNVINVHYQGACGTCPSSTTGTLSYIETFLKDTLHHDLTVIAQ